MSLNITLGLNGLTELSVHTAFRGSLAKSTAQVRMVRHVWRGAKSQKESSSVAVNAPRRKAYLVAITWAISTSAQSALPRSRV